MSGLAPKTRGGGQAFSGQNGGGIPADPKPPRLFQDTFSYAAQIVDRLAAPRSGEHSVFTETPDVDREERLIRMSIPNDMRVRDSFGFAGRGVVDGRYMPPEAVGAGDRIELTDRAQVVSKSVENAKMHDQAWPSVHFLWDCHPILEWFADRTSGFFPDHSAPVASLSGNLESGEVVVILHGAISNESGVPIVDSWAAMVGIEDAPLRMESVHDFLTRTRLSRQIPSRGPASTESVESILPRAVQEFQGHLVALRRERKSAIESDLNAVLDRLDELQAEFRKQIRHEYGGLSRDGSSVTLSERRRLARREAKEKSIEQQFEDWAEWHQRTRHMVDDPHPHVDVVAVFVG